MFSCEICELFQNTYFEEHLQTAASVSAPAPDSIKTQNQNVIKYSKKKEYRFF